MVAVQKWSKRKKHPCRQIKKEKDRQTDKGIYKTERFGKREREREWSVCEKERGERVRERQEERQRERQTGRETKRETDRIGKIFQSVVRQQ